MHVRMKYLPKHKLVWWRNNSHARKDEMHDQELTKLEKNDIVKKIEEISEGTSVGKVAPKVKIHHTTLSQTKKIKQVAEGYTDKDGIEHPPEPIIIPMHVRMK